MPVFRADHVWTPSGLLENHCVEVHLGKIVGIGSASGYPHVDVDLANHLLMPGLVDAHSHSFQRAIRGRVQWSDRASDDFWTWRDQMYGIANRLGPAELEVVASLAFLEMVEAGITCVGEFHYLHHQPDGAPYADRDELAKCVIRAARRVGMRICLLRVAYERASAGAKRADQRRFYDEDPSDVLDALERLVGLATEHVGIGLAAHSVRALSRPWLEVLSKWDGVLHAHVSEQPAENESCLAEHGMSPSQLFASVGMVREGFQAVHLTHPMPGDVPLLVERGAGVVACPTTELDLGDGFLPLEARLLPLSLGTDSHAVVDPFWQMRCLELHARGVAQRRLVMGGTSGAPLAHRLLGIGTHGGAAALGRSAEIAVGQPADFIAIDLSRPGALGVPPLECVAFVAQPEWVSNVWVGGTEVVSNGRSPERDAILRDAAAFFSSSAFE